MNSLHQNLANALRFLSIDAVEQANSGHPGMPMGMADIATVLWLEFLQHNPQNPSWFNRDRFVLSNGHGSMLLYAALHLSGYDIAIKDLQQFRQLHSITPGHPELNLTPGVEVTTGPLGQGFANAVGLALAEKILANKYNIQDFAIVKHYTYCFLGDGCLMEGISHEAASFAGNQALSKLICFWDDNSVSIDGDTAGWFTEDVAARFKAYGWHVIPNVDGHNADAIKLAILAAQQQTAQPTLICCKTIIGFGSPNLQGKSRVHGSALGPQETKLVRENLGWQHGAFYIPEGIYAAWNANDTGQEREAIWNELLLKYKQQHPKLHAQFLEDITLNISSNVLASFAELSQDYTSSNKALATRKCSQLVLENLSLSLPNLIGGSADLSESNLTQHTASQVISKTNASGNYIHYGVREFAMAAIMNGLSAHRGIIPYGGTFLVFSDYAKNAIRMSALMGLRVIYVLTHDSIGLGEDGPTHQPVEHLSSLRLIPNMHVWRPADIQETIVAWKLAILKQNGPSCLVLSRQNLPAIKHTQATINNIERGAYIISHEADKPIDLILLATGSEVNLALAVVKKLTDLNLRVISMPCVEIFRQQDTSYKQEILPTQVPKLAIEAAATNFWHEFVNIGKIIGVDTFGFSAKGVDVYQEFGINEDNIINVIRRFLIH